MTLKEHAHYERLENGMDLVLVPTAVEDVVVCKMAFPGGTNAIYHAQSVALLLAELMPGGTRTKRRSAVRAAFNALGADMSLEVAGEHTIVSLACRRVVFEQALALVLEVLLAPRVQSREYREACTHVQTMLSHAEEETRVIATNTLLRALYSKGHPHWAFLPKELARRLRTTTQTEVLAFQKEVVRGVGALVCVAGDVSVRRTVPMLRTLCSMVPGERSSLRAKVDLGDTPALVAEDHVVSLRDKMNVDIQLGIPLALTREHAAYHALHAGVRILGGSATGRLFHSLRTKQSLTYGAYASLGGMSDGYPGYITASAIFPNDVFLKGRTALRAEVEAWAHAGITAKELAGQKEEVSGRHKVGLSTTTGLCATLFETIRSGKDISYIDAYPKIIAALTVREVNHAIRAHVRYDLGVTAAAGSVTQDGLPLT